MLYWLDVLVLPWDEVGLPSSIVQNGSGCKAAAWEGCRCCMK